LVIGKREKGKGKREKGKGKREKGRGKREKSQLHITIGSETLPLLRSPYFL
jgi:hypothetical protein